MRQFVLTSALALGAFAAFEPPECRWVEKFTDPSIFRDPASAAYKDYVDQFLRGEAQWVRGLGTEPKQGWTLDGQRLDTVTGLPLEGGLHNWTASSKECMQWFLIARILYDSAKGKDCLACKIWSKDEALALLRLKMGAYKTFDTSYPGFGGFFPWMKIDVATGTAGPDAPAWANHVPALDNAELFWPLWATAKVLEDLYKTETDLIAAVKNSADLMLQNGKSVFYNADVPGIRTDSFFTDQTKPVDQNTYGECDPKGNCINNYLDDVYEGELFHDMIAAFPDEMGFSKDEVTALWEAKKAKTQKASVRIQAKTYETELGWTFSSHEKWKYLMVPYLESANQKKVFDSGEKIRTMYANDRGYAGLWGAMTGPMTDNDMDSGYHASVGIPYLAMNEVTRFDIVTPYGAYPTILANQSVGMAWLHNMISAPQGQNIYGTTEGFATDGATTAAIVTWDTKITNVMALLGGIGDITKDYLVKEKKLSPLVALWDDQWAQFGSLEGYSDAVFEYPKHPMPIVLEDFTSCAGRPRSCGSSPAVMGSSFAAGFIALAFFSSF